MSRDVCEVLLVCLKRSSENFDISCMFFFLSVANCFCDGSFGHSLESTIYFLKRALPSICMRFLGIHRYENNK